MDDSTHYLELAAAFARGRLGLSRQVGAVEAISRAEAAGLRLHRFKRNAGLPRVRRVLGILKGLAPVSLLDVGSGRGVFLWPLLDELGDLEVSAIDVDGQRARDLGATQQGGADRLRAFRMDAEHLAFEDGALDVVTVLEVLEHMARPASAAAEAIRVARRAVIVTVPSKPDDNPLHVRLFDKASITALLEDAGASSVSVDGVRGHFVAVASVR